MERDQINDRAVRLFKFLREFTLLRTKVIRTYERYPRVIWFNDFPSEPGCHSVFHTEEALRSDVIIEITRPILKAPPAVPEQVLPWIDLGELSKSDIDEPRLNQSISVQFCLLDSQSKDVQVRFEELKDHPLVGKLWEQYVTSEWKLWAKQDLSDREILKYYEKFYDIYQTLQKLAEKYELLLGVGLLAWHTPGNQTVMRHLLTCRVSIAFDMASGILSIVAPVEGIKFQLEQDMLEINERPGNNQLKKIEELLDVMNEEPWVTSNLENVLRSWFNATSAHGTCDMAMEPSSDCQKELAVRMAPAIILRERTERGFVRLFEEIINSIEETELVPLGVQRLVTIMDDDGFSSNSSDVKAHSIGNGEDDSELYFPLPANAEQNEIANKLKTRQGVLVQGPPGTGKSHTIANLVCHLLATGKRILVTSHTPRALEVLREKFPEQMRALCISVVGDGGEEARKALEESVSGITSRYNAWDAAENKQLIADLKNNLHELRQREAWALNALLSIRENDTYIHPTKFGIYTGTTQTIAQLIAEQKSTLGWLSFAPEESQDPPLNNADFGELVVLTRRFPREKIAELRRFMPQMEELLLPEEFTRCVTEERTLKESVSELRDLQNHPAYPVSVQLNDSQREELTRGVDELINTFQRILNRREPWVKRAAQEIISDQDRTWRQLQTITKKHLEEIGEEYIATMETAVAGLEGRDQAQVRVQANELISHLNANGNLGAGPFRAKPVKEGMFLIKEVRVNGSPCDNVATLNRLINWLDLQSSVGAIRAVWLDIADIGDDNAVSQIARVQDWCEPLDESLILHEKMSSLRSNIKLIPGLTEPAWDDCQELAAFRKVLAAGRIEERRNRIGVGLEELETKLRVATANPKVHPAVRKLLDAVLSRDEQMYHAFYKFLLNVVKERNDLVKKEQLKKKLSGEADSIALLLEQSSIDGIWDQRAGMFSEAWNWKRAAAWLELISNPDSQSELSNEVEVIRRRLGETLGQLAEAKAWSHAFSRLNNEQHSHLIAWSMAVRRIGKVSKYGERHSRDARLHMQHCKSAIPAWIMPIHTVVDTMNLKSEPFDVVIIDEASQSGPEALFLMQIAKQIVVVGDDKQISPDSAGIDQEHEDALRKLYLKDIPFSDAIGVRCSFFDQAKIRYRGTIRLKEHFRCMPEIIQFSNNLCYRDDPLIPLRQFGDGRLSPVVQTRYLQSAYSDDSHRVVNKTEADAIIEQIKACCNDPAYEGKTIGVISLLNTSGQADYIEREIRSGRVLSPADIEARKLRVGDSYMFQGDERDIIFLSMVATPAADGRRIHAMTQDKDERRFNVAVSRARDQLWLFHSVSLSDLNPECVRHKLLEYCTNPHVEALPIQNVNVQSLREQLERSHADGIEPPKPFDSWFEVDVYVRLIARGYRVIPQYKLNGYHIDLVVEGLSGRLAVECDGDRWHGPDRYEHDAARQRDLERCGMQFWRVRGSSYYLDRDKSLQDLWTTLEKMKIYASESPHNREESDCSSPKMDLDVLQRTLL